MLYMYEDTIKDISYKPLWSSIGEHKFGIIIVDAIPAEAVILSLYFQTLFSPVQVCVTYSWVVLV